MAGFAKRFLLFLGDEDRAVMTLFGSKAYQSISGSVGRACGFGDARTAWWGPPCQAFIEFFPWWGKGHCQYWAEQEQRIRLALESASLTDI